MISLASNSPNFKSFAMEKSGEPDGVPSDVFDSLPLSTSTSAPFGHGLPKNPIKFVPASREPVAEAAPSKPNPTNPFLELWGLKEEDFMREKDEYDGPDAVMCDQCKIRINPTEVLRHEASRKHELNQPHIYPPSAIDRTRKGASILQSKGWDPDARKGLGASGQGELFPVKAKENPGKLGLGAANPSKPSIAVNFGKEENTNSKVVKGMSKKQKRKMEAKEKEEREIQLRSLFFGNNHDLDSVLGPVERK
jgi:hypothetical protein